MPPPSHRLKVAALSGIALPYHKQIPYTI